MPGTVLENLSGKKLSILVSILLICQVVCFLIGGFMASSPAGTQGAFAIACYDETAGETDKWFTHEDCKKIDLQKEEATKGMSPKNLVFVVQLPLGMPPGGFSRWQQNLVGVLQVELVHIPLLTLDPIVELTLDAKLGYKDEGDTEWHHYANAVEKRLMDCSGETSTETKLDGYSYSCSCVPLFELGSLYHDFYILNLRLPDDNGQNNFKARVDDIQLHVIHMNGGFTMIWMIMKFVFFPIVIAVMIWFWRRVRILSRTPALLEYMLISLAGALAFLDLPLEYLTLYFDMPFMLLLSDIRQGIFYSMLLSFWLIFAGEHMLIQDFGEKNTLKMYWKHLSAIVVGCTSLLIFDLCERGVQLRNPFYTIWVTPIGTNLALSFIILAGMSASIYFIFLCYLIWRVFRNISIKRTALPSMSTARRLHYEGIIYRFNFLMLATVVCAAVTIITFIFGQVCDDQHNWDDGMDDINIEIASAMYTGVYGMWNIYISAMLMLYAPSHKQWPAEPICGEHGEEVEFSRLPTDPSPNEISSLTSFANKATID